MQNGSYAEPYRFKPFGTTKVEVDGILQDRESTLWLVMLVGKHGNAPVHEEHPFLSIFIQHILGFTRLPFKAKF